MPNALELFLILMLVAVLAVWLFRYWKLPAMLGYLFAGTLIGPYSLGIVPDSAETRHLAEFGVVFLMFSIGLEFSLPKLHAMRKVESALERELRQVRSERDSLMNLLLGSRA